MIDDAILQDAEKQQWPFRFRRLPVAADQPEHRVLQDIERIVGVPDGKPGHAQRAPLHPGQEPLHGGPLLQKPLLSLRVRHGAGEGVVHNISHR